MTSYGKSVRGKRAPPPLPMYERVTLKHVPTMVRRKYDHVDLLNLPDQQNEDEGEGEGEGEGESESESEIDEFNSSEQGSVSVDGDGGDRSDDDEHPECILDSHVKDGAQEYEHEDPSNDLGSQESEDSDLEHSSPIIEVDAVFSVESLHIGEKNLNDDCDTGTYSESLGNENSHPSDLDSDEDNKGEFDAVEDENPTSCANSSISTEAEEMGNESLDDQHNTLEQMHNDDYGHEVFVRNKSLHLRDLENKGDGTEDMNGTIVDYPREAIESEEETHNLQSENTNREVRPEVSNEAPIVDSHLEDEIHDILSDFSNLHGDSVDDNNGAEDMATPNYSTVRNALHYTEKISVHEQGLCSEDNKGEFGEVEDRNPTLCANDSVNNKAGGIKCGNVIDQQGTLMQLMQACNEFGPDNVGQNSLHLMDLKIKGDGTKDVNGIVDKCTREAAEVQEEAHRHYGEEQDFNPEAFKKTVKENGYELCCPYCNQCITNTLIYQRRENIQQNCRITCFTRILSLFCCIRD